MTDMDILMEMLDRTKIEFERSQLTSKVIVGTEKRVGTREDGSLVEVEIPVERDELLLNIEVHKGYSGFYTTFTFNSDGKLLEVGAYER